MTERTFTVFGALVALYLLIAVACFGPATVQSERARDEYIARCKAEREGDINGQRMCVVGAPMMSDGAPKAIFWPLWLSYMAASSLQEDAR